MKNESIASAVELLAPSCQPAMVYEMAAYVDDALHCSAPLPPTHLSGYAGLGKTHAIESLLYEKILKPAGWNFAPVPVACVPSVWNKMIVERCGEYDRNPTLFFIDEIHALPKQTKNLIKIATETGGKEKTYTVPISREEFTVTIRPQMHWFISASNESVKDSALVGGSGRFTELAFLPYDEKGKEIIFSALLPIYGKGQVKLIPETKGIALKNVRPFARSIKNMIIALRVAIMHGGRVDTVTGIATALRDAGYFPGGWTKTHIDILRYLSQAPMGRQVQEIAMSPCRGRDRDTVRGLLDELLQGDLVVTNPSGRKQYTKRALELLKAIDAARAVKSIKPVMIAADKAE